MIFFINDLCLFYLRKTRQNFLPFVFPHFPFFDFRRDGAPEAGVLILAKFTMIERARGAAPSWTAPRSVRFVDHSKYFPSSIFPDSFHQFLTT